MTSKRPLNHCRPAQFFVALAIGLLASRAVLADAEDTFSIMPGISLTHDDNIFRISPSSILPSTSSKSDDITTSSLALTLNKSYSLQRFELEASYVDNRYRANSDQSYNDTPYKAAWRWSLTPYLHGNLTTDRATTLYNNNQTDYTNPSIPTFTTQRILTTNKNSRFDGVVDVSASWHLLAGVSEYTYSNSVAAPVVLPVNDVNKSYRIKRAEAGIRHTFSSGSMMSYIARSGRGEYFDIPPTLISTSTAPFDETENELRLLWTLTAKTTLDARLANLKRRYDSPFAASDYSGNAGSMGINWAVSAKSYLNAAIRRDLSGNPTSTYNYVQTDRITLIPYWKISEKTALRARFDYAQSDYLGRTSDISNTLRTGLVAFDWQPLRTAIISATFQNEKQDSNQALQDYKRNMVSISAQIAF